MKKILFGLAGFATVLSLSPAHAQTPVSAVDRRIRPPSLGAFLPPVIKAQSSTRSTASPSSSRKRTPDAYAHSSTPVSLSSRQRGAAHRRACRRYARHQGVTYLFNLFDFWGRW